MQTRFDHFTHLPGIPTPSGAHRLIFSELGRGEYLVPSSPFAINLVLEGEEIYEIDGERLRVTAGEMLVIDAGVRARVILAGRPVNKAICFCLAGESAEVMPAAPPRCGPARRSLERVAVVSAQTSALGRELLQKRWRGADMPDEAAGAIVASVLCHLPAFGHALREQALRVPATKESTRRSLLQRLERSHAEMRRRPHEPASIEELARAAGMSMHHFARAFREVYCDPPARFQQRLRMEAAANALAGGDLTPGAAAERLGFADQASFTRAFRRHMGAPPGAWPKKHAAKMAESAKAPPLALS